MSCGPKLIKLDGRDFKKRWLVMNPLRMISLVLLSLALQAAVAASALGAPKTSGLSEVACECSCTSGGGGILIETKKIAPPNGDAKACGQFNNVSCRNTTADGGTRLGKLSGCEAVVTITRRPHTRDPLSIPHKLEEAR
jgi:hypothetical protein